jgi:hypothetical protein
MMKSAHPRATVALLLLLLQVAPLSSFHVSSQTKAAPAGRTTKRSRTSILFHGTEDTHEKDVQGQQQESAPALDHGRRSLLLSTTTAFLSPLVSAPEPANAGGLLQFPCIRPLKNRYIMMRAGTSLLEADNIYSTNPLFLTNRENALDTSSAKAVLEACGTMKEKGLLPTVAYHSLAANSMDTGDIIANELRLGRDRLLPEFTYLDPRGIGLWDSGDASLIRPAVWAMDKMEAGKEGFGGRPPANEDGTPNETLADQFVRLRQFLSLQEARTSGENILIIFPDSTGPALLSAMIAGVPLSDVHCLEFAPGEVRLDVSRESVLELYKQKKEDPDYLQVLDEGKEKLALLRQSSDKTFVSLKDIKAEQERIDLEEAFQQSQREKRQAKVQAMAARPTKQLSKKQASSALAGSTDPTTETADPLDASSSASVEAASAPTVDFNLDTSTMAAAIGVVGLGAAAAALLGGDGDSSIEANSDETYLAKEMAAGMAVVGSNGTVAVAMPPSTASRTTSGSRSDRRAGRAPTFSTDAAPQPPSTGRSSAVSDGGNVAANVDRKDVASAISGPAATTRSTNINKATVDDELSRLEVAQREMDTTLKEEQNKSTFTSATQTEEKDPVQQELNQLEAAQQAMNAYLDMDDGGDDWLRVLAEIRDEPDVDDDEDDIA